MSEKERRFTKDELDRLIPPISPDDPLFTRGWIVGRRVGGPRSVPRPEAPEKKPEERK